MIDFSKIQKGSRVVLKDGRTMIVSGMYLSGNGPCLMCKTSVSQTAAENVPLDQVEKILEG